jgi:predicted nucleic acid-binding protein
MREGENKIVVNTSPWIALSICGYTKLLKQLYKEIYMPVGVKEEILAGREGGIGVNELKSSSWLKIRKVADAERVKFLYELECGEAEVIILAKEKKIKQVLIDEKVARLQAKVLGLEAIGTLGLLLKAKKRNLLSEIKPLIEKMLQKGIWIKKEIIEGILKEAGEIEV